MNTRQWALYKLLKQNHDTRLSRREIQLLMIDYYPITNTNLYNDTSARLITSDIQEINACPIIQKIIISDSSGIKIANKQEFKEYADKRRPQLIKELARLSKVANKSAHHNFGRLTFTRNQRPFIEAYIER